MSEGVLDPPEIPEMAPDLNSPEVQFDLINDPNYFNELKNKLNAIIVALESVNAKAPEIRTEVRGVPIIASFEGQEGVIKVGTKPDHDRPFLYHWRFPIRWLEEETN